MREQIAEMILRHGDARIGVRLGYYENPVDYTEPAELADQILSLMREEIEKVENPYLYQLWQEPFET